MSKNKKSGKSNAKYRDMVASLKQFRTMGKYTQRKTFSPGERSFITKEYNKLKDLDPNIDSLTDKKYHTHTRTKRSDATWKSKNKTGSKWHHMPEEKPVPGATIRKGKWYWHGNEIETFTTSTKSGLSGYDYDDLRAHVNDGGIVLIKTGENWYGGNATPLKIRNHLELADALRVFNGYKTDPNTDIPLTFVMR